MRDYIVAKRYAEAFLEAAKAMMPMEQAIQELTATQDVLKQNPELAKFFGNVSITSTEKLDMADKVFAKNISEITASFLRLLLRKDRFDTISEIAEYARILYERTTGTIGVIRTARPLGDETVNRIRKILEQRLDRKILLTTRIDPILIGGIQVAVAGMIIDGSLQKRLYDMREKLRVLKVSVA